MKTREQIKQNAEEYARQFLEPYNEEYAPIKYVTAQMAHIAGAHSRDEEVELLQNQIEELSEQLKMNAENIQKLRNPWISVEEHKPEAVEQKEFGYRRLSKQVLCVYEDGKCHVERYDHDCNCWRWANGYGQMYEPKMWRYIDTPKLSNN